MVSTLALPMTMMPNRARVKATFKRRGSLRNPTPWCSFDRTHDKTMKSFSRPWNASTLATSISCNTYTLQFALQTYKRLPANVYIHQKVKVKKVKTWICIVRLMYKTPLMRIPPLKLSRQAVYLGHHTACKHSPAQ